MSIIAAVAAGLLRLRWYAPIIIAIAVYPIDLLLISYLDSYLGVRSPRIPRGWEGYLINVMAMCFSAYLLYGATYSLALAWIGALPIRRRDLPPPDPDQLLRRRTIERAFAVMMRLAGLATLLLVWQAVSLRTYNEVRAVLSAIGIFAGVGAAILYQAWFLRR